MVNSTYGKGRQVTDDDLKVVDGGDQSKKLRWEISGIATGTTVTMTAPTSDFNFNTPTFASIVVPNITPGANFTFTQNSVVPFTSVESGAVANTLYLKDGNVGFGMTNPAGNLHVFGITNTNVRIHSNSGTGGVTASLIFRTDSVAAAGDRSKGGIIFERHASATFGVGALHLCVDTVQDAGSVEVTDAKLTITRDGNIEPGADNTQNFGSGSKRWKEIFAGIGTINTSDARKKIIKGDSLGLEFIKLLKPHSVKFKDEFLDAVTEMRPVERQKTVKKTIEKQDIELINGKYIVKVSEEEIDDPVFEEHPLFNEAGKTLIDGKGNPIMHRVPVMETVDEQVVVEPAKNLTYKRKHCLLQAQEVLIALESLGLSGDDFGGYVDGNVDGSGDYFGLRYDEFIAPLIRAVQQIDKKLDAFIAAK